MWSSLVSILVGLHNVELWAEVVGRVGVAVPEAVRVVELAILGHGGELDKVDGSITAALSLAEVHIILNRASKEVNLEDIVGSSDRCVVGLRGEVHTAIGKDGCAVTSDVGLEPIEA